MLEIQKILKIYKCGLGGYFQRICDQHREFGGGIFDDTEYRKSGHLRIEKCGTEEQRSLILRCPPFATKEVTFDLFTSVQVTWRGWSGEVEWGLWGKEM